MGQAAVDLPDPLDTPPQPDASTGQHHLAEAKASDIDEDERDLTTASA